MSQYFRILLLALILPGVLGGCYYSTHHGDADVFHHPSIFDIPGAMSPWADSMKIGPKPVDRRATYVMHVRDLPRNVYPNIAKLHTDDEETAIKDDPTYVAARKKATGETMALPAWRSVVLRLTYRTLDGQDIFTTTLEFATCKKGMSKGDTRGWDIPFVMQLPRELPGLPSYDVVLEVLTPSSFPGDNVSLNVSWFQAEPGYMKPG